MSDKILPFRPAMPGEQVEALEPKRSGEQTAAKPKLITLKASEYVMRGISWLWHNRFAIGKLALIGGLPDKGKGLIGSFLCACVTNKIPLPCNEGDTPQGSVLYFTAEDDPEDTVVPRLAAAGADLDKVHIVKVMGDPDGKERTFSMITDLPALEAKLDEIKDVRLVIIDPMSAYIGVGKANVSSTGDVRGFLKPLTDLAAKRKSSCSASCTSTKRLMSRTPCSGSPTASPMLPLPVMSMSWSMIPKSRIAASSSKPRTISRPTKGRSAT